MEASISCRTRKRTKEARTTGSRHRILRLELVIAGRLAAASLERGSTVDLRHGQFVRSLVAVDPDDAASLAVAEALIAETASAGLVLDELLWIIGLARWLPDGHQDRRRLMARAGERIDESGFGGLRQFLDS